LDSPYLFDPLLTGSEWHDALIGERIGPYRIRSVIGEGGMGIVYAAEQEEPIRRLVALKLIKPGLETRRVLARFDSERQTLALMDHPNIARIYDAGTTAQGHPYFVMEQVEGISITEYCDREGLSVGRRLELFIQVCRAVQHAHQRGIIHRDLKPSNILVAVSEGWPVPKVIDFGVAKALHPSLPAGQTSDTQHLVMIGTPEYMSPEQARRQDDIDTRTDVYSLGILLFRLLTGVSPFGADLSRCQDYLDMISLLQQSEVRRPRTALEDVGSDLEVIAEARSTDPVSLRRRLRGELEWIILKAVDRERRKRYSTVLELSNDLERHLEHQRVSVGPPGTRHRTVKFVRRHRFGVAVGITLFLLLSAFLVVVSVQSYRLSTALTEAERQQHRAEEVSAFLLSLFRASDPYTNPGKAVTLEEVVDKGAARIETELEDEPEVQASLLETLGEVYRSLGHNDRARPLLEKALAIRRRLHGEDHVEVADSLYELGLLMESQGQRQQAEQLYRQGLKLRRERLPPRHPAIADSLTDLARLRLKQGDAREAESMLREALEIRRHSYSKTDRRTAQTENLLGACLAAERRDREAEPLLVGGLAVLERQSPRRRETRRALERVIDFYRQRGASAQVVRYSRLLNP
ncbi:MAG: serine/threonine-protein kinase, partial [Acidobacteriota bacterium]